MNMISLVALKVFGLLCFTGVFLISSLYVFSSSYDRLEVKVQCRLRGPMTGEARSNGSSPRVLCMVMTMPRLWESRTQAVRDTWGQRCHVTKYFFSKDSVTNIDIPSSDFVPLSVPEGRSHLTNKTFAALQWSVEQHGHEVDWYLKVDDDSYIVYDNLVLYLSRLNHSVPQYVGRRNVIGNNHYAQGGAYLLNTPAATALLAEVVQGKPDCKQYKGVEDMEVARCLRSVGISVHDLNSEYGDRIFSTEPLKQLELSSKKKKSKPFYLTKRDRHGKDQLTASPELISMHYVSPERMYMYDYLLYHVRIMQPSGP